MQIFNFCAVSVALVSALTACKASDHGSSSESAADSSGSSAKCALFDPLCMAEQVRKAVDIKLNPSNAYTLDKSTTIPSISVDKALTPGGASLPPGLQGIWWFDGNPLHDLSFTLDGSPSNGKDQVNVEVARAGIWAWYADEAGERLFKFCQGLNLHYEINLDTKDGKPHGYIIPIIQVGTAVNIRVPDWVANFTMDYVNENQWERRSSFFGKEILVYQLRRIVTANGTHTENWDLFANYTQKVPAFWLSKK